MPAVTASVSISTVTYPGDNTTMRGFLARPAGVGLFPAVIVIQEWWGVNDHIKDIAQRFAREEFVALAPDLYNGQTTADAAEAAKLMERLSSQLVLRHLNATTHHLKTLPGVDPLKLGAVGFSMGGTFALMMAAHNSDVKAAVSFYGQIPPTDSLKYLVAPVLYIHGAQDTWIPKREADRLAQALKQFGRPAEVAIYPDCPHAFFNDTRPEAYRPRQANDAWQHTLTFLRQHLR